MSELLASPPQLPFDISQHRPRDARDVATVVESVLDDKFVPFTAPLDRAMAWGTRMTPASTNAIDVATRLWARVAGKTTTLEQVALAAERVHTQLRSGLGRWIGAEGYRALVDRALAVAEPEHPALGRLAFLGGDHPVNDAAAQADQAAELSSGMVALVAVEIDLLGRIVGEEMAARLIDQIGAPNSRGAATTDTHGETDD